MYTFYCKSFLGTRYLAPLFTLFILSGTPTVYAQISGDTQASVSFTGLSQTLEIAGVGRVQGSMLVEILDKAGKPLKETKSIQFRLFRDGTPYYDLDPQHLGKGLIRFDNIPLGTYTMQAYFVEGDSQGDSVGFSEEIRLSPDEQIVNVVKGVAAKVTFTIR